MERTIDTNPAAEIAYRRTQVEQIAQAAQNAKAALYRQDGQPLYGDAEMSERMAEIRSDHAARLNEVRAEVESYLEIARGQTLNQYADPMGDLPTDQLHRASLVAPLVKEDLTELDTEELSQRLRWVMSPDADSLTKAVYGRYAGRVAAQLQRDPAYGDDVEIGARVRMLRDAAKALAGAGMNPKRAETAEAGRKAQDLGQTALREIQRTINAMGESGRVRSLAIQSVF